MKILIVQLSGLNELFLSIPTVRALQRAHPGSRVDLLTCKRFRPAVEEFLPRENVLSVDDDAMIEPLLTGEDGEAAMRVYRWIESLRRNGYQRIVNLSFTSLSSYICAAVADDGTDVRGYTRTGDGYLAVPDDMSAYMRAQCGPGGANRVAMHELFASVADVELAESDWVLPEASDRRIPLRPFIALNLSCRREGGALSVQRWRNVIIGLLQNWNGDIALTGAEGAARAAAELAEFFRSERVLNFVGGLRPVQLTALLRRSRLLVSCDDPPVALSGFTGTPCLFLSDETQNAWESAGRAVGGRVIQVASAAETASDMVVTEALAMVSGEQPCFARYEVVGGLPALHDLRPDEDFSWALVRAIYQNAEWPSLHGEGLAEGMRNIEEINELVLEQLGRLENGGELRTATEVLKRADEIFDSIMALTPTLAPLIKWMRTEKVRIGPGSLQELVHETAKVHAMIRNVTSFYRESRPMEEQSAN